MAIPMKTGKRGKQLHPRLPPGPGKLPPRKPIEEISDSSIMACPMCHSTNTRTIPGLVWCMACGEAQILTNPKGS